MKKTQKNKITREKRGNQKMEQSQPRFDVVWVPVLTLLAETPRLA